MDSAARPELPADLDRTRLHRLDQVIAQSIYYVLVKNPDVAKRNGIQLERLELDALSIRYILDC